MPAVELTDAQQAAIARITADWARAREQTADPCAGERGVEQDRVNQWIERRAA